MSGMLEFFQQISPSVKLGWVVCLIWAVVQIAGYRRMRLAREPAKVMPAQPQSTSGSTTEGTGTVDKPLEDDTQVAPVEGGGPPGLSMDSHHPGPGQAEQFRPVRLSGTISRWGREGAALPDGRRLPSRRHPPGIRDRQVRDLRREFGSRRRESGASDHDVRGFLGHANISTTSRSLKHAAATGESPGEPRS